MARGSTCIFSAGYGLKGTLLYAPCCCVPGPFDSVLAQHVCRTCSQLS
jgi:hypothetical protein